jgi:CheY-like chemotaxis protein
MQEEGRTSPVPGLMGFSWVSRFLGHALEAHLEVDLVILDLKMPGLSGAETLPRLRALRPDLPVLLATGYGDQEIQHLLANHANVGMIWKPFTLKELKGKLESLQGCPVKH